MLSVQELWRYPVKSLQGERLDRVRIETDGLLGDRRFAIFDVETGLGLTARREPRLLMASARWCDGGVEITLPDGVVADGDDALSEWLGRRVALRATDFDETRTYEFPLDVDTEAPDSWVRWNGPRGAFHDLTTARVSLVSRATIGGWDARRFRANVVLDGSGEDELVGSKVAIGGATLEVTDQIPRCVMVTRPQPDGIERDVGVLKTIMRDRAGNLAIGALVAEPGDVKVGDELSPR